MALERDKLAWNKERAAIREQARAERAEREAGAKSAAGGKRGAKGAGKDAEDAPKPWMTEEEQREYLKIDFGPGEYRPMDHPPLFPGSVGVGCDMLETRVGPGGRKLEDRNHETHERHEKQKVMNDEGREGAVVRAEAVVVKDRGFLF